MEAKSFINGRAQTWTQTLNLQIVLWRRQCRTYPDKCRYTCTASATSQTEHAHVTSTQIKKHNLTSTQKPPSCASLSSTPPHPGIHHPDFYHHSSVLSVLELYLNGVTQSGLFCVWLFSLDIMLGKSIGVTMLWRKFVLCCCMRRVPLCDGNTVYSSILRWWALGHRTKSTLFLLLKLCCHPQMPAHKRVDKTFSKVLETRQSVKHTNPQLQRQVLFSLQSSLEVAWVVSGLDNYSASLVAWHFVKHFFQQHLTAPSDVGVGGRRGCPHAIDQETEAKGSDFDTPGGKSNNQDLNSYLLILNPWLFVPPSDCLVNPRALAKPWRPSKAWRFQLPSEKEFKPKPVPDILEWKLLSFEPQLFSFAKQGEGSCSPPPLPPPHPGEGCGGYAWSVTTLTVNPPRAELSHSLL